MPPPLDPDFPSPGNSTTTSSRSSSSGRSASTPARPSSISASSTSRRLSTSLRRPLSSSSHNLNSQQSLTANAKSFLNSLISTAQTLTTHGLRIYTSLPLPQRIAVLVALTLLFALGVTFLVYSHRIFTALGPLRESWRASGPVAWCLIWLATCATGFPPIIGYSTCVTVAGFVYGFPAGWPLAASATVCGSTAAFLTSRGVFAGYVQRLVGGDRRFVALGQVLRRDGVGVLVMVRLCPLPYSLSNGFLATVSGRIGVGRFALATACATPKLFIHVFIGSQLARLAESGDKMSGTDRALNYISMVVFGILGVAVGLFIYRRTMARAEELAREEGLEAGDALLDGNGSGHEEGVVDGYDENGPLVHPDDLDAAAIMDDDDISLWDTEGGDGYRDSWDDGPAVQESGKNGVVDGYGVGNGVKR